MNRPPASLIPYVRRRLSKGWNRLEPLRVSTDIYLKCTSILLIVFFLPVVATSEPQTPSETDVALVDEIREILLEAGLELNEEQIAALAGILQQNEQDTALPGVVITERLGSRADDILSPQQQSALRHAEAGRLLLNEGVDGLREVLAAAGVPSLTFNQETQVRMVHEDHVRVVAERRGRDQAGPMAASEVREIEEQLLLASLRFLNPAQRTALTGSLVAASFGDLNSDLPEDEAELIEYLGDLRSPAATEGESSTSSSNSSSSGTSSSSSSGSSTASGGASGLIINGFSGGRMPNRDEIQEIRINENSFTSEQSNQSRGRTEIITRGGVGRFNGDVTFIFADQHLDARNAFASSRPPYQERNLTANISGPVIRDRLTMTFSLRRDTSEQGDTLTAITPAGLINDAVVRPQWTRDYTTRATAQLSETNVLNVSYSWGNVRGENQNVGGFRLPEQGTRNEGTNFNFQIKESAVLSRRLNNEVRFRANDTTQDRTPINSGPHINVLDAFGAGGATENVAYTLRGYEFGDLLMYSGDRLALRLGYDGHHQRITVDSRSNFNGTFTFSRLYDYCGVVLGEFVTATCQLELLEAQERKASFESDNPGQTLEITPRVATYAISQGEPAIQITDFQSAAFVQSDWRVTNALTLFFGVRYEWQDSLDDSNNIDPRIGWAYSLGANTVLRGGSGIFHQRLIPTAIYQLARTDGTRQQTFVVGNPSYDDPLGGETGNVRDSEVRVPAQDLATPYTWNSEASIETSFSGGLVLTGSYRFIRGVHLYRSRNLNSPFDTTASFPESCFPGQSSSTCVRLDPTRGNVNQLESTGVSANHNFRIGFRQRMSFLNLNGSYNFNSNYDDVPDGGSPGGGNFSGGIFSLPADNFDLASEWGRSGARHGFNTSFNVRLPWDVNANTILNWSSGEPYTETTGTDDNQDIFTNDRPSGVPRNSLTGPGFSEVGFNLSKAIQLRSDTAEIAQNAAGQGPLASGGYYGQRRGLRMTVSANVTNLLNKVNYQSFSGVRTSPFFGLPTRARNPRQMTVSVRFDF